MSEDLTRSRQAADWPAVGPAPKDRAGQAWRLGDFVFLIVSSELGRGMDAAHSWHRCVLLDDPFYPDNTGKHQTFVEKQGEPWEEDEDEPSWERVA